MPDPGFGGIMTPFTTTVQVTYGNAPRGPNPSAGIQTGTPADWFGPLNPLSPIAPPEVRGRSWDFPVGYNTQTRPRAYEPVSFAALHALADTYDLMRIVIETRKDQLSRLDWSIVPKNVDQSASGKKTATPAQQKRADQLTTFFRRPFRNMRWAEWIRRLLEDLLVIDAPTLFVERSRGGQILSLRPIAGSTILRVIDDWGNTPEYPLPAFQQVLKGLPALDFTTRDLLWRPRNLRNNHAYGLSPVEQIMMTVNVALRRQVFTLNYFTEGNIPESLIGVPEAWSPDQITAFQNNWDQMLQGDLAARRRAKFVPGGVAKTFIQTKDPELKGVFDEWLARLTCYAFSVSAEPFVSKMNRATAETAHDSALEEGLAPLQTWLKDWIDDIVEGPDGFNEPDFEFKFQDDREVDPVKQETVITGYTSKGVMTFNEGREILGLDPVDDPSANELMVLTMTGMVPLNANTIEGKQANIDAFGLPPAPAPFGQRGGDQQNADGNNAPPSKGAAKPAANAKTNGKTNAKSKEEVGKSSLPFVAKRSTKWKRLGALKYDRPSVRKGTAGIKALYVAAFAKVAKSAAKLVRGELDKVAKDSSDNKKRAKIMAERIKFDPLDRVEMDVQGLLEEIASDAGSLALAQIGVDDRDDLVDQVNEAAVRIARDNAAELVSSIDETTRDDIRDIIADGLDSNLSADDIADLIQDSTGFSDERADLIARTEVSHANSEAAVEGYKAARDDGVMVKKEWLVDEDPCPICEDNANQGAIDVDDDFESGDDSPPAHPNCECAVSPVVEDDGDDNSDE